jgi:ATP-dependent DNA ligase
VDDTGQPLIGLPLAQRRPRLEAFAKRWFKTSRARASAASSLLLSPATQQRRQAEKWFRSGGDLDGVVAKRRADRYKSGERAMLKIKRIRSADCVVGGFRYASRGKIVGSLLLGLYDDDGVLHHVGFTSSLTAMDRKRLTPQLESLVAPPGFTGRAPGGPSRWSSKRSMEWRPLRPKLVVEVHYDHFSGGRFRHGTRFMRWRPDKAPAQCTFEQVAASGRDMWKLLAGAG